MTALWWLEHRTTGQRRPYRCGSNARAAQRKMGPRKWKLIHGEAEVLPQHIEQRARKKASAPRVSLPARLSRRSFDYHLTGCVLLLAAVLKDRFRTPSAGVEYFRRFLPAARAADARLLRTPAATGADSTQPH